MPVFPMLKGSIAALLAFTLLGAGTSRGDDEFPKKDDALDRLLEKIEETSPAPQPRAKADADTAKAKPEPAEDKAKADEKAGTPKSADAAKSETKKGAGDVAPKDQALDSLLEKLGETRDKPDTEDERRGGPPMPGKGEDEGPGKETKDNEPMPPDPGELTGKDRTIDERLEELTGRKRKKKESQDEEASGPLAQVIKEMREVEQRLGKPDTGEETRKKQTEIVKNLDQLIEQLRASSAQSKGQKKNRLVNMPGQKPGSQPGQQPGANPGGAPNTKPARPESKHAFAGGKDEWGHLPPELRQEIDNIAREIMLPSKEELIRLYYLSVSKKSLAREE